MLVAKILTKNISILPKILHFLYQAKRKLVKCSILSSSALTDDQYLHLVRGCPNIMKSEILGCGEEKYNLRITWLSMGCPQI